MPLILALETATPVCSAALARNGEVLALRESAVPNAHSAILTIFIEELFSETSLSFQDLDAISVSMGPGSYTGLRIGVAAAKGLCFALDKPLIAVPTLEAMAEGMKETGHPASGIRHQPENMKPLYCPMIDARRMEVYCAVYDENLNQIRATEAEIVTENSFGGLLAGHRVLFAGTGAEKCKEILSRKPNAKFLGEFHASARFMIRLSETRLAKKQFENLAYFEPYYLKDFVAGKPRVKGLQ